MKLLPAPSIAFDKEKIAEFVKSLPFELTNDQRISAFEILKDIERPYPMNRLLNGDVGSGKTIVATIATLQTASHGFQTVILAPTEVLARQHFEIISNLLSPHSITTALLTSSYKKITKNQEVGAKNRPQGGKNQNASLLSEDVSRTTLLKDIKNGLIKVLIGTHALLQEDIRFKNLALIVVDEQHRFGVQQRAFLQQKSAEISDGIKNATPHFLTMTATPIPRTLSLAFFGNLDFSFLYLKKSGRFSFRAAKDV